MTTEQGLNDQKYLAKLGKKKRWNNHLLFKNTKGHQYYWNDQDIPTRSHTIIPWKNGKLAVEDL